MSCSLGSLVPRSTRQRWVHLALVASGLLANSRAADVSVDTGRALAARHCVTCHLLPDPQALDRRTWREQVLPRMKWRLGFTSPQLEVSKDVRLLRSAGRVPSRPVISEDEWQSIAAYYFAHAPETPLPQSPRVPIRIGLRFFETQVPEWRSGDPSVTWVGVNPRAGGVWLAEDRARRFQALDAAGRLESSRPLSNVLVSLRPTRDGWVGAFIGSFQPTDEAIAAVLRLRDSEAGPADGPTLLSGLPRTADAIEVDLNGDGRDDLAVSVFGNNVGRYSWFEALAGGGYREHILLPVPGSLRSESRDFDGDGRPDLAVLVAQETEALFLFLNQGDGRFQSRVVFQKQPHFGHSHFQVVDFDRDGRLDFLVANGDNGEFDAPMKREHGLRLYLNLGDLRFEEAFFFPMNGAYKAHAEDFDQDGDLDVAAVSYFPDFLQRPEEGFVLLENRGDLQFAASTFPESLSGRWLTLDAGDLDQDGDIDLVLGAYMRGPRDVPDALMQGWTRASLPVIFLRNTTRTPARP